MPGFGFSDAPPLDRYEYTFENIANTFHALIDELGLKRMFLYVHDYGAGVAFSSSCSKTIKTSSPSFRRSRVITGSTSRPA